MKRLAMLAALCLPLAVQAHTRSYSYSLWELDTQPYRLTVRINQLDLTRLQLHPDHTPDYAGRVSDLVMRDLRLSVKEQPCSIKPSGVRFTTDGWTVLHAEVPCNSSDDLEVRTHLLLDVISSHMHFVTVVDGAGQVTEKVLTEADSRWQLSGPAGPDGQAAPGTLGSYWLLGIEHILTGWDHLAFVLGLMLLASGLSQLAWLVTGFTLAHSITLALAALGHVQPVSSAVEALIGLSILLVAIENVWERNNRHGSWPWLICLALVLLAALQPAGVPVAALLGIAVFVACYFAVLRGTGNTGRWRLLIAFAFGLFHGFGFAGILAEMSLPDSRLLPALFGFNLGVETGQLAVVALLWPLLHWRRLALGHWVHRLGTTTIAGLGTFWFITRIFV